MIEILFEDDYFLAAVKPSGLPSQATVDKTRPDFFTTLKKQLQTERGKDFYLALHHRLDRDTSGVMIFAKNKQANEPLADLFKKHQIQKTYLCLARKKKKLEKTWVIENHLQEKRDAKTKKMKMVSVKSGGDKAITSFECLEIFDKGVLIQAQPRTGRMHQIRVHLAEIGMGIFGDDLYDSPKSPVAERLMLHAFALDFIHPLTQERIHLEAPLPDVMSRFMKML